MRGVWFSLSVGVLWLSIGCSGAAPPPLAPAAPPAETVRVQFDDRGQTVVRDVPLEAYVAATALSEFAPAAGRPDAVEAMFEVQTIVARTYAVAHRGRHAAEGFDLCSTTHCQLYEPGRLVTSRWAEAARVAAGRTAALVILYGGAPADVVFHADCGGYTSAAADVWGGAGLPYLPAQPDDGPASAAHATWQFAVEADALGRMLDASPRLRLGSPLAGIRVVSRDGSGRVARLRLEGPSGSAGVTVAGTALREAMSATFGARGLRSTLFDVVRRGRELVFSGKGFGHGVGLCQVGALARVTAGQDAGTVLAHYFPGTVVSPLSLRRSSHTPRD